MSHPCLKQEPIDPSYLVNIMAADDLAMEEGRAAAAMLLT